MMRPGRSAKNGEGKRERGFTLLELVISISLLALIVLITAGAMGLGAKSVGSCEKRTEALERYRMSMFLVDAQIQSHVPLTTDDAGARKHQFRGDSRSLHFTTNYSIWSGTRGYVGVTYTVENSGSGKLALHASENTVGMENKRAARLFDYCSDIRFEYYFQGVEEEGRWMEQWTDDYNIPERVRITLAYGTGKTTLVIPVRAKGDLMTAMPEGSGAAPLLGKM